MKLELSRTFAKDLERITDAKILARIEVSPGAVRRASALGELRKIKRMAGARAFYRIRVGDIRLGFEMVGGLARSLRCLDRKDIYRHFP